MENIRYGSYPQNDDYDDLPIEFEQRLFKERLIDHLTDKKIESLKVSFFERLLDKKIYESNPRNADYENLPFGGDEKLIARQQLYRINDTIVFRYINGSSVYVKTNRM